MELKLLNIKEIIGYDAGIFSLEELKKFIETQSDQKKSFIVIVLENSKKRKEK